MTLIQHFAKTGVPGFLRRNEISAGIERAWADTDVGPLDPLRESDLLDAAAPAYDRFALTMPMPLTPR